MKEKNYYMALSKELFLLKQNFALACEYASPEILQYVALYELLL